MSGEENLTGIINDNSDKDRRMREDRRKEQIPVKYDRRRGDRRLNIQLMKYNVYSKLIPLGKLKR